MRGLHFPTCNDWRETCLCLFDCDESGDVDLADFVEFEPTIKGPAAE
ncbi:MAG: hypothetical protein JSU63_04980 [Phycisphaerales bacterium]|nr:MAG: hypothetical protein JSU63_04980 [Phycisphaerales bacterium]